MNIKEIKKKKSKIIQNPDVVLVGTGIMSATLGLLLKLLKPDITIQLFESLSSEGQESSHVLNNAGTGHSALCELNYTPENKNGEIMTKKALGIYESFEISKQFWAYLIKNSLIESPSTFITQVPHMSFVRGKKDQEYLKKRFDTLKQHHFFEKMEFTTDPALMQQWAPLLTSGRDKNEVLGLTRVDSGTDVNYGTLVKKQIETLLKMDGVALAFNSKVTHLKKDRNGRWNVTVSGDKTSNSPVNTAFVFIGAGGGTLKLLQKSKIPESKIYGGFPVSGQFLICQDKEVVKRHKAKVYGKAKVGAPPMSVPHLDTRMVNGKRSLLFGPFAGFSPKFLKSGSVFDLLSTTTIHNIFSMFSVALGNLNLLKYLYKEVVNTHAGRIKVLQEFYPEARATDWKLHTAGQRVQIIKKMKNGKGVLQFGTEVVSAADGSLAALLGASPGASTCVNIALEVLERCFPTEMNNVWGEGIKKMVPSYKKSLKDDPTLFKKLHSDTLKTLKIEP